MAEMPAGGRAGVCPFYGYGDPSHVLGWVPLSRPINQTGPHDAPLRMPWGLTPHKNLYTKSSKYSNMLLVLTNLKPLVTGVGKIP